MSDTNPADARPGPEAGPWPLLDELHALRCDLQAAGYVAQLGTLRDVLLVGTAGGGIITAALSADRSTWWANGAVGCLAHDLAGDSLTTAVREEVARHARLAAATDHQDALLRDAQRLEGIA